MKKVLLVLALCVSIFASDSILDKNENISNPNNCSNSEKLLASKSSDSTTVQQSGCCSYHGGVKGCSLGTVVCSDGWLSSCSCLGGAPIENDKQN